MTVKRKNQSAARRKLVKLNKETQAQRHNHMQRVEVLEEKSNARKFYQQVKRLKPSFAYPTVY